MAWAAQISGSHVYCFEADPELAAQLPATAQATIINAAISDKDGSVLLYKSAEKDSSSFFYDESSSKICVTSRSLESFIHEHNIPLIDLLKLDIEGWELQVLETLPDEILQRIAQITCEFHDFLDRSQVPRIRKIIARFRQRGWLVVNMAIRTYGDVLFVNQSLLPLTLADHAYLYCYKYWSALGRIMRRLKKSYVA